MSALVVGRIGWTRDTEADNHRTYRLRTLIRTTSVDDGPAVVSIASGLPLIGAPWVFGNDNDPWAFCVPSMRLAQVIEREPSNYWTAEQTFTTRPMFRCQTTTLDNPLSEPQKISGSFVRYRREGRIPIDRLGHVIKSSSHEPIFGIEKDRNRATVVIEQNTLSLGLPTFTAMVDTLNDATLWGLPKRCIKLGLPTWEKKYYGTCTAYYTRKLEFEIRFDTFDEYDIVDAGYKVLDTTIAGASAANPAHFIVAIDRKGHKGPGRILLNGSGVESATEVLLPTKELYSESNFLTLGIPTSL